MANFDGIIVGAGVAGSTTAALLARQGFRVLLVEKATFPREKVCGEGLMPAWAVDPVTGQVMTVALKDAQLACRILKKRLHEDRLSEQNLCECTRARNDYFRPAFQLAQMLLWAVQYPFLTRQTLKALSRNRTLRQAVLRMATL
jgi:2-polyprenyl-6-methoxyphenol hydroxylase-like FAD-dependent oxidoreductase